MTTKVVVTAVGVFADRSHAEYAMEELRRQGFGPERIGMLTPDAAPGVEAPAIGEGTKAEEGGAVGAATGAAVGGLVGAALTTTLIPGVGPVLAGGLLVGALGGAVTGLLGGSIVGTLVGLQIPEEEAHRYEREYHSGRTLVTVRADERYDEAVAILREAESKSLAKPPAAAHGHLGRLTEDTGDTAPGAGTVNSPRL